MHTHAALTTALAAAIVAWGAQFIDIPGGDFHAPITGVLVGAITWIGTKLGIKAKSQEANDGGK